MFVPGDHVVCGNNGICVVQDITNLNISGVDKRREYYLLKPVYLTGSTVYIPVDTADKTMRKAVSRQEALSFIDSIPDIPLIQVADEKTLEKTYKEYMHQNSPKGWLQLIKTIYLRREKRILKGSKITALDSRYFKQAEDFLYGELSVALEMTKDEVRDYIVRTMEDRKTKKRV